VEGGLLLPHGRLRTPIRCCRRRGNFATNVARVRVRQEAGGWQGKVLVHTALAASHPICTVLHHNSPMQAAQRIHWAASCVPSKPAGTLSTLARMQRACPRTLTASSSATISCRRWWVVGALWRFVVLEWLHEAGCRQRQAVTPTCGLHVPCPAQPPVPGECSRGSLCHSTATHQLCRAVQ